VVAERATLTGGLEFMNILQSAVEADSQAREEAAELRRRAERRRKEGHEQLQLSIHTATERLIDLQQAGKLTHEEAIVGVFCVNKYLSDATTDAEQSLRLLSAIEPEAPVVSFYGDAALTHIVDPEGVHVAISTPYGVGGQLQATLEFQAHEITTTEDAAVTRHDTPTPFKLSLLNEHSHLNIGVTAIQELLNDEPVENPNYTCGGKNSLNGDRVRQLSAAASRLIAVGYTLDVARIDTTLATITGREAKRQAYQEQASRNNSGVSSRGKYIRKHTRLLA